MRFVHCATILVEQNRLKWDDMNIMNELNSGLTGQAAKEALGIYGSNEIRREKTISPIKLFLNQLRGPMTILLFVALVISGVLREVADVIACAALSTRTGLTWL